MRRYFGSLSGDTLLLLLGVLLSGALLGVWLAGRTDGALIGLLGVLIGSGISNMTAFGVAKNSARWQLYREAMLKRVQTHQHAFRLWRELVFTPDESLQEKRKEAETWWENNCFYLTPEARKGFYACIRYVSTWRNLLNTPPQERSAADCALIEGIWEKIQAVGRELGRGADQLLSPEELSASGLG
jgi:hypothetical protein